MITPQQIQSFTEMLDDCGLSEERKNYWAGRLQNSDFDQVAAAAFVQELNDHAEKLEFAVKVNEADLASKKAELAESQKKAVPLLENAVQKQKELDQDDLKNMKKELGQAEDEFMTDLKSSRTSQNEQDIEVLRKKLASGK
ncbi:MAG: hypothetical protein WC843_04320 [Candidatus Gracilibacteria bacterium]|jgi:hypothetical protein